MGDDFLHRVVHDVDLLSPLAFMGWVAPTMTQYGALAALGAGANALFVLFVKIIFHGGR